MQCKYNRDVPLGSFCEILNAFDCDTVIVESQDSFSMLVLIQLDYL